MGIFSKSILGSPSGPCKRGPVEELLYQFNPSGTVTNLSVFDSDEARFFLAGSGTIRCVDVDGNEIWSQSGGGNSISYNPASRVLLVERTGFDADVGGAALWTISQGLTDSAADADTGGFIGGGSDLYFYDSVGALIDTIGTWSHLAIDIDGASTRAAFADNKGGIYLHEMTASFPRIGRAYTANAEAGCLKTGGGRVAIATTAKTVELYDENMDLIWSRSIPNAASFGGIDIGQGGDVYIAGEYVDKVAFERNMLLRLDAETGETVLDLEGAAPTKHAPHATLGSWGVTSVNVAPDGRVLSTSQGSYRIIAQV